MNTLKTAPKFMIYALSQAIRHPATPVSFLYCPECKQYLISGETICPICGKKLGNSPQQKEMSPIPWWGAVLVIIVGVACWVMGSCFDVIGLDEAGGALVYIPLGSLFGMSLPR
jgi:hypothetical protein